MQASTKIFILLCFMSTVGRFGLDMYLPSLPAIGQYFNISPAEAQITFTLFLVGFSISQVFYGAFSDYYGRRKVLLSGFVIFLLGVLMSIIAKNFTFLLLARFITGLGAGATASLKRAIASDTFKGPQLLKINAVQNHTILIVILIAPVIGGYIQYLYGWRINFLVVLIYGLIIFLLLLVYLPDTRTNTLLPQGLNISNITKCYHEVLCYPPFIANVTYSTCSFTGMIFFEQVSSFLLIDSLKISTIDYGWLLTSLAVSYLLGGIIVNRLSKKIKMKYMILMGILLFFLSTLILLTEHHIHYFTVIGVMVPVLIFVSGNRIILPITMSRCITPFPEIAGYASALMSVIQTLGAAAGCYLLSKLNLPDLLPLAIAYLIISITTAVVFCYFDLEKSSGQSVATNKEN